MALLTKKRQTWAAKRAAAPQFQGAPLRPNAAVGMAYAASIERLVRKMTEATNKEVLRLFESPVASQHLGMDASLASQARILTDALSKRFAKLFADAAKPLSERMLTRAEKASKTSLHSSLEKLSGGLSLKTSVINTPLEEVYKASVAENVALIKSIQSEYLQKVQGAVMRSITTGNGLQDLLPALEQYEGQTYRRARNIALDQTRKAHNSISARKMKAIGVKQFKWIHSGGGAHPRQDHVDMDGQVYSFDKLPVIDKRTGERGIPGQAPNCRCSMSPVFTFGDD